MKAVLRIAPGPRAAEALLLDAVLPFAAGVAADPSRLARPLRVVVPSRSLRDHVSARLLAAHGRALAGVQVQTLFSLALEVLGRAGEPARTADRLFDVLVRDCAAGDPVLGEELGRLDERQGAAVGTVRDLVDGGLSDVLLAEVADERLADLGDTATVRRARALVRTAQAALERLGALGLDTRATLYRRAAALVEEDGGLLLPRAGLVIHGFADATGSALELLRALLEAGDATLVLDQPRDPADASRRDLGCAFTERLAERVRAVAEAPSELAPLAPAARLAFFSAPGSDAELRAVALRVRALLDGGVPPESVAVVARRVEPLLPALARHFDRLAIPWSAPYARGRVNGTGRVLRALLDLLEEGVGLSCDRWLDAQPRRRLHPEPALLRLALHTLGAARVGTLAQLDLAAVLGDGDSVPLPVRAQLVARPDDESGAVARRARIGAKPLARAVAAAAATAARLEAWPAEAPLAAHLDAVRALVQDDLGWSADGGELGGLVALLDEMAETLPAALPLRRGRFLLLLERSVGDAGLGTERLGGEGGGVQVLDAMQARGRTFARLFLPGLERDQFPRVVLEDPLLPDALRVRLAEVLPDLPRKLGGLDEERYLFAQLLASSPEVTLSWQYVGDDGRARTASTFVERLRRAHGIAEVERVPALWNPSLPGPRPAFERAVEAALHDRWRALPPLLPLALREAEDRAACAAPEAERAAPEPVEALAAQHVAVLRALDPPWDESDRLGPFDGLVGRARLLQDPRRAPLAITTLEGVARCAWQAFLRRGLRLAPGPDALASLPGPDAAMLGAIVHATVESLVRDAGAPVRAPLEAALSRSPVRWRWPLPSVVRAHAEEAARAILAEDGHVLPALARALAEHALPLLEGVRRLVMDEDGEARLLGSELEGRVVLADVAGNAVPVTFRADLLEAGPVATDLKTGRSLAEQSRPDVQRRKLLEAVSQGTALQAMAYARALGARGRYLYVHPERAEAAPRFELEADDPELGSAFDAATATLLSAWSEGALLPRLVGGDADAEPRTCEYCEVAQACNRGDTGARRRLVAAMEALDVHAPEPLRSARALHRLGREPS